jgi:hypothetical protein
MKININKTIIKSNKIIKIVSIHRMKYLKIFKNTNRLNGKLTTKEIVLY